MWPLLPERWSKPARASALIATAIALALYVWWPMIEAGPRTVDLDGRYAFHQWEVAKAAILQYREFPLWNPFDCRGIPLFDHPEGMTSSPILLLSTWLSTTKTVWVWNVSHAAAGFVAMWLLARHEVGLARTGAFVAASAWAFATCHTSQYAGAHVSLEDFWLAPALLLLWRRAEHDGRAAVGLGLLVAFMLFEGATYPLPYSVLVVGLESLTRMSSLRRALRIARAGVVTGVVAIGVAAARLLPLFDQLTSRTRDNPYPDVDHLAHAYTLDRMFLWREGHWWNRLPDQQYVWGEYVAYVGVLVLALAVVGLVISAREHRWLVFLGLATFALMLGHFAPWSPWSVLQLDVFPFKAMRVPSRFRLLFQMFVALWAAIAVDRLPRWIDRIAGVRTPLANRVHVALFGAALLGVGDAVGLGKDVIEWMHQGQPESVVERSPRFYYEGAGLAEFIDQPRQNRAWTGCRSYEWPGNKDAPVWTGDVAQARSVDDRAAVVVVTRTHNTFTLEVDAKEPATVLLNSGHAKGWRTNVGSVVEHGKMLAVEVPAGRHVLKVRYWPKLLTPGLWISGVSLVAVAVYFAWPSVRRRFRARSS